jgi:hypothetical protein
MTGPAARVTAVVTTFRPQFPYLEAAVRSALEQRVPTDVLVSDSGADEAVRAFVGEFGPRVRYRSAGKERGVVGAAENHRAAIAEVRTPYFALLGHDDVWEAAFVETLLPALDAHPECALAFSDHWFIDSSGAIDIPLTDRMTEFWGRRVLRDGVIANVAPLLAAQSVPLAMAALVRTDIAHRHPIPDAAGPAYDLWLHYAIATEQRPYWYSSSRLTRWRYHSGAATGHGNPDWYRGVAFAWDAACGDDRLDAIRPAARHRSGVAWLSLAKALARRGAPVTDVTDAARHSLAREFTLQAALLSGAPMLARTMLSVADRARRH